MSAKPLDHSESDWVQSQLLPGELQLWGRFSVADQRHSYKVARRVTELLGDRADRPVIAAALLHDIGKTATQLGTFERVLTTMAGSRATEEQKRSWWKEDGWLGRAGSYLMHHEIGAEMLAEVGSDATTISWAREHELVHTEWTLPEYLTDALWKADNGR